MHKGKHPHALCPASPLQPPGILFILYLAYSTAKVGSCFPFQSYLCDVNAHLLRNLHRKYSTSRLLEVRLGFREMAQLLKQLPWKHENQNSNPIHLHKSQADLGPRLSFKSLSGRDRVFWILGQAGQLDFLEQVSYRCKQKSCLVIIREEQ